MTDKYILVNKTVVPEPDLFKWAEWFGNNERHVDDTYDGDYRISTVFLGIDHGFGGLFGAREPILFETMVFHKDTGSLDLDMDRYSTYQEAEEGHKKFVTRVSIRKGRLHTELAAGVALATAGIVLILATLTLLIL